MADARMITATTSSDVGDALWLKHLILGDANSSLPSSHPLRSGFDALRRSISGQFMNDLHREDLANLKVRAQFLRSVEPDWHEHSSELIAKLQDRRQCPGVLFELELGSLLKGVGLRPRWTAFEQGVPDWSADDAQFEVECKQAQNAAKSSDYSRYLREIAGQHPNRSTPLVAAIGFAQPLGLDQIDAMREEAKRYLPWLTRHREISAVLIVGKESGIRRVKRLGLSGFDHQRQTVTEIRNLNALRPLPSEVQFGNGRSPAVFKFPGAMDSLTRRVGED